MSVQAFFPTQIYFADLQRNKASREAFHGRLLREIAEIKFMDKAGIAWSKANYANGFTSFASVNNLQKRSPTFAELEELLDQHVARYAKALDFDLKGKRLSMTNCWVNIMPKNTHHGMHIHPLSVISGTYYVSIPEASSAIKFEDPRLDKMMAAPPRKGSMRSANRQFVSFQPDAGKLVLFESWLRHEVPLNRSAKERISISFNYA